MRTPHRGVQLARGHHSSRANPAFPGAIPSSRGVIRADSGAKPEKKKEPDEEERDSSDTATGAATLGAGLLAGSLFL